MNYVYENLTENPVTSDGTDEIVDDVFLIDDPSTGTDSPAPPTPDILGIISQTVHLADTGQQVVDVVFDVEDISGVEYEFQVAKIS